MENVTISLRDLLTRILKKWRFILICIILGAVLLNCFGVYRAQKHMEQLQAERNVTIESLKQRLSENELWQVESYFPFISGNYDVYTRSSDYLNHSICMQLDPNAVPTLRTSFAINTDDPARVKAIMAAAADKLQSVSVLEKASEFLGDVENTAYVGELIRINEQTVPGLDPGSVLKLRIIARSEEECRKINDLLLAQLEEITPALRDVCGDFSFQLLGSEYSVEVAPDLFLADEEASKLAKTSWENYSSYYFKNLNEAQQHYVDALILGLDSVKGSSNDLENASGTRIFLPKYILVGALLGAFVAVFCLFFSILLGGRLLNPEDLTASYGVPAIGTMHLSGKKWRLFQRALRFPPNNDKAAADADLEMIITDIRIAAGKKGWKKLFLASSSADEATKQTLSLLSEHLKDHVDSVCYACSVAQDPFSLEALSASDAVVLVERVDVSLRSEIQKTLALCQKYGVPVLGCVTQV